MVRLYWNPAGHLGGFPPFGGLRQGCGQIHRIIAREQEIERTKTWVLDSENSVRSAVNHGIREHPTRR
jgi:hypothetical protein